MKRFLSLDGIRGFLAITVMLNHIIGAVGGWKDDRPFSGAYISVVYFFIMSGFVLTIAHRNNSNIIKYFFTRLARLMPLHIITIFLMVIIYYFNSKAGAYVAGSYVFEPKVLLKNIFFLHGILPESESFPLVNDPSWSISIEFWCSLLIPLLAYRVNYTLRFLFSTFGFLFLFYTSNSGVVNFSLYGYFQLLLASFSILMGSSIADFIRLNESFSRSVSNNTPLITACVFSCSFGVYMQMHNELDFLFIPPFLILLFIDCSERNTFFKRFFSSPVSQYFGKISFPLYLIHSSIIISGFLYMANKGDGHVMFSIMSASAYAIFVSTLYSEFIDMRLYSFLKSKINYYFS
ncbi:acyltransferase family protein [Klebsiella pneumoniae]|uniref:acyltransferase family protein n=1 Tax=Klebsiella pneumoniae TaxID=573 RepID=UPI0002FCBBB4|nr:acyltransferase [Klebsiella pneumoniae]